MYSIIPIHRNIKSAPASPGRSRVGPAFYVFSFLASFHHQKVESPGDFYEKMENGKCEVKMNMKHLPWTQSFVVWKRNCNTCAVELATVVPVSLLSVYTATSVLWFCSTGSSVCSVFVSFSFLFSELKGSVSRDFLGPFLACMDRSRSV
jgi:hypothetical protein